MEEAVLKLRSSLKEKLVKLGIKPEGKGITRHLSRLLMQSGPGGGGGGGGGWGERVRGYGEDPLQGPTGANLCALMVTILN